MKRILVNVAGAVAVAVAIVTMANFTQNRPDPVERGSVTVVHFDVATRRAPQRELVAAATLWQVCTHQTVGGKAASAPVAVDEGYEATLRPAIGEHGRRRLVGCLEDATVDRIIGRVVSITTRSATTAAAARPAPG